MTSPSSTTPGREPSAEPQVGDAASHSLAKFRLVVRDGAGAMRQETSIDGLAEALEDPNGVLWLDIENLNGDSTDQIQKLLQDVFGFHPLAVDDALRETHLPKLDDWGDYLYIVFHGASIDPGNGNLNLNELDIFLGLNYLVTYHTEPLSFLEQERKLIKPDDRCPIDQGPDYLLFRILERAADRSLEVIESLDELVNETQDRIIRNPRAHILHEILRVKRSAIRLHRIFGPQREVLNRLARDPYRPVQTAHQVYFRDIYDHIVRIHDVSESLRDLIAGTLDTYLTMLSNRTNEIMKTLTIVTVMCMPTSILVGFFGMNFFGDNLAFHTPLPRMFLFVSMLIAMVATPTWMWFYARRKKWF